LTATQLDIWSQVIKQAFRFAFAARMSTVPVYWVLQVTLKEFPLGSLQAVLLAWEPQLDEGQAGSVDEEEDDIMSVVVDGEVD